MGLLYRGGGSYNWVGALTWNLSCVTSLSKVMRIAQNGAKKQSEHSKDPGRSWEPRWRKNNQLVLVSEKNGVHSVLDKNAVDLLWSFRRNWQLVVN